MFLHRPGFLFTSFIYYITIKIYYYDTRNVLRLLFTREIRQMKIYIFSVKHPKSKLMVVEIYSNCYYNAYWFLVSQLEVYRPEEISFVEMNTTAMPLEWDNIK